MSDVRFTVPDAQLADQILMGSVISDSHYVWMDPSMQVITEDGPWPAAQTAWFLEHGVWVTDLYALCDEPRCILPSHLTADKDKAEAKAKADKADLKRQRDKDEELMRLVERQSVTLATLYKKGKARGLLSSRSAYQ